MITFDCDACGAIFMVSDDKAGGRGKCPKCGTAFVVPAPAARTVSSISPAGSPAADLAHERATSQAAPADAVLAQEEVVNFYWPTDSNALDELVKAIESRPTTSLPSSGGHSPLPSVPRNRKTSTPKAFGASADRPEVGTVAPSYSAQDDVALAKELVKMAEAEKIKSKQSLGRYWFCVKGLKPNDCDVASLHFNRLETNGGYVVGIRDSGNGHEESRVVIPARNIRFVVVAAKAAEQHLNKGRCPSAPVHFHRRSVVA